MSKTNNSNIISFPREALDELRRQRQRAWSLPPLAGDGRRP